MLRGEAAEVGVVGAGSASIGASEPRSASSSIGLLPRRRARRTQRVTTLDEPGDTSVARRGPATTSAARDSLKHGHEPGEDE